jgi:RHS repeat-associated protein
VSEQYNAGGELESALMGNGLTETNAYNNRMRLTSETVGPSGSAYSLALGYAPNGDVLTANDSANGNWTYTYDDFNRMVASSETSPQTAYSYGYDRFGNRWSQTVTAGSGYNSSLTFDANNHITSGSVGTDIAGNVDIANTGFSSAYTFDYFGDNNINWVWNGSSHVAYFHYDGFGRRTEKVSGSSIYYYYHDLAGHEVAVMDQNGNWIRGEVYAGGKHIATYVGGTSGTTYFDHDDLMGTERARTTATGGGAETCQSLPFGDGQSCSGSDISPMHMMGKERDPESNLDDFGARFYSSTYGRWMSPDWSATPEPVPYANLSNPQSLNLYALVQDNPETFADLDGHDPDAQGPGNLTGTNGLGPCQKKEPCGSTILAPSMTQDEQAAAKAKADQMMKKDPPLSQDILGDTLIGLASGGAVFSIRSAASFLESVLDTASQDAAESTAAPAAASGNTTGNAAADGNVTGFTKHGINQAISRDGVGVADRSILDAVKNPTEVLEQSGGRTMYVGKDATVITNAEGKVVTTWANGSAGTRIQ